MAGFLDSLNNKSPSIFSRNTHQLKRLGDLQITKIKNDQDLKDSMDIFSTTLQDIHANGFPPNWSVPKVAAKEAPWANTVLPRALF